MKKSLLLICILFIISSCSCNFYDHIFDWNGWKDVIIPTESMAKAEIKIPNNWRFKVENKSISLINNETNEIIAEQVCQAFGDTEKDEEGKHHFVLYEGIISENYILDFYNEKILLGNIIFDGYNSNAVFAYELDGRYIFCFSIYYLCYFNNGNDNSVRMVIFYLLMRLTSEKDYETFTKALYSYSFGGTVEI